MSDLDKFNTKQNNKLLLNDGKFQNEAKIKLNFIRY